MQTSNQSDFKNAKAEAIKEGTPYIRIAIDDASNIGSAIKEDVSDLAKETLESVNKIANDASNRAIEGGKALADVVSSRPYLTAFTVLAAAWLFFRRSKSS